MKTALITGGSSGIGLATAEKLMQAGMRVYAASRNAAGGVLTAPGGGKIIPLRMDVNKADEIDRAIEQILAECGRLDILVCCAGNGMAGALEETGIEEAQYQFETCFWGMTRVINACLPVFRRQKCGRIVTVSSVAGIISIPFQGYYSAVKAAVLAYTKALAMETKPFGIKCCCVLPGDTKTNFTATRRYAKKSTESTSAYIRPMRKAVGKMERDEQNGMSPHKVAACIVRQLSASRPALVVVPRADYKLFASAVRLLPNKWILWLVEKVYL